MRRSLDRDGLDRLLRGLAEGYRRSQPARVFIVGGGTAVYFGWRESTIDADLFSEDESVFHEVQQLKERLALNIELVRPEDFVPELGGTADRHLFIRKIGQVSFFHYDPYAQLFAKIVRGFRLDLLDGASFLSSGMVDPARFRTLVLSIPAESFRGYPALSQEAVISAVEDFLREQKALP